MRFILLIPFLLLANLLFAQGDYPVILSMKDRAQIEDQLLMERFEQLLPSLMRKHGIDMWVLSAREYNEDPIVKTMLPAEWLNARRRTILVFYDPGNDKEIERISITRYNVGIFFKSVWKPEEEPDQWKRLNQIIQEKKPSKIGLNLSSEYAHADGWSKVEYDSLMDHLNADTKSKIVSAEKLAVDWLQTRTAHELEIYEQICRIGHEIIAEGFSEKVIHPGITKTSDVEWWLREKVVELKLSTWFHPTVDVQRRDEETDSKRSFSQRPDEEIIRQGDLIHVDFGISYLRLNTDVQQIAYVLKSGEKEAPDYLVKALASGNALQDYLTNAFKLGKTGNEILKEALSNAKKAGLNPTIYTHPIGYHGHAAGPTIGLWDQQNGVWGSGDFPMEYNTAYAIELNNKVMLKEWNKEIRIMLEEQAVFTKEGVRYIDGREEKLLLIPRKR